jgi:2OG-Fe(II) oxygenase superfamily
VRRTWQIDADQVRIRGRAWASTLEAIVARVAEGLGVTEPVTAALYKLLACDEGGFFASHRDTEKMPGMFATLVIVLPSLYTGGELVVRHKDREARFDLRCPEPSEAAFAAFYADCRHEVLPVTSGCRLTLIYNLSRLGPGNLPRPPSYETEPNLLAALLRRWGEDKVRTGDHSPDKLIYPLEHAYTQASLSFEALKGADTAKTATLLAAAREADCELHLALLSIEESGSAEHTGGYRSYRRGGYDDEDDGDGDNDEFEVIEVVHRSETLSDWRRPDGGDPGLGILPFDEAERRPTPWKTWPPTTKTSTKRPATRGPRSSAATAMRPWCCGQAVGGSPSSTGQACRPRCHIWPLCPPNGPPAARTANRRCGLRHTNSPATC